MCTYRVQPGHLFCTCGSTHPALYICIHLWAVPITDWLSSFKPMLNFGPSTAFSGNVYAPGAGFLVPPILVRWEDPNDQEAIFDWVDLGSGE